MKIKKNGPLLMMTGNLFFALIPITIKWANQLGYGGVEETFFRFAFAALGILILAWAGWQKLKIVNTQALFWRGLFGGATVLLYFIALQSSSAGKATLFNYTYSIWANVFAVLFLKRKSPRGFPLILGLASLGVWLVLDIQINQIAWGDLAGVLSGMIAGASVLASKEARRTDNALTVFGSFTFFGFLMSGLLLLLGPHLGQSTAELSHWTSLTDKGWLVLLAMGVTSMTAQLLFTEGYGYASLAMGTILSLQVPVLAAVFGLWILGEPLTPHFILGTALVLAACGALAWDERRFKVDPVKS